MVATPIGYGYIERRYMTESGPRLVVRVKTRNGNRMITIPAAKF